MKKVCVDCKLSWRLKIQVIHQYFGDKIPQGVFHCVHYIQACLGNVRLEYVWCSGKVLLEFYYMANFGRAKLHLKDWMIQIWGQNVGYAVKLGILKLVMWILYETQSFW